VWVTGGSRRRVNQETPPMRIYIIGNDGITLCREAPATIDEGEIVVASREELHSASLSGKRLLALWNALPAVEKRRKVGDREGADRSAVVSDRGLAGGTTPALRSAGNMAEMLVGVRGFEPPAPASRKQCTAAGA
jgi:hypothetical protein